MSSSYHVTREDDFDFGSTEYAELFANSQATAFQHPVWLRHLYDELAPRLRATKRVIAIRRPDGSLSGVLPLVLRRRFGIRHLEYADLGVNDYAAAVLDPGLTEAVRSDGQLSRAVRTALGSFDLLRIERAADTTEALACLLGGARVRPHHYRTHVVDLPASVEAWPKTLQPDFARHLERKYKRLRPKGTRELRIVTDTAQTEEVMGLLREFRATRFGERGGIDLMQQADYDAFYRSVATTGDPASPVRLAVLEVGGRVVAVALDLDHKDRELFLLVGYDVERLRNYSLGLLIVDELVRSAIDRGRRYFDLTVGDEPYKADFGAVPRPLFEVRIGRTPLGVTGLIAHDVYLSLRQHAKQWHSNWTNRKTSTAARKAPG